MTVEHIFDIKFLKNAVIILVIILSISAVYAASVIGPVPLGGRKVF